MSLLQVKVDKKLKRAIQEKSKKYGVPASSLVRIVLMDSFLLGRDKEDAGNIFNAYRDTDGKGIPIDDLIRAL